MYPVLHGAHESNQSEYNDIVADILWALRARIYWMSQSTHQVVDARQLC